MCLAARCSAFIFASEELDQELEQAGLELMDYDKRWRRYRVRLHREEVKRKSELLTRLMKKAHDA